MKRCKKYVYYLKGAVCYTKRNNQDIMGTETIWLQRPSGDIPWGFRLQGGRELRQPLTVQRVCTGTLHT